MSITSSDHAPSGAIPAEAGVTVEHHFSDNEYAKAYRLAAGQCLIQHRHNYSHLSVLAQGRVALNVDGVERELSAPACLTIEAGKHHGIRALTPVVWYCIHAASAADEHDDADLIAPRDISQAQRIADSFGMGVLS